MRGASTTGQSGLLFDIGILKKNNSISLKETERRPNIRDKTIVYRRRENQIRVPCRVSSLN